ncbi:PREDICTED: protein TALPID3 isoform X3 [Ficedula albicollis]|uniref:protein TALPID3 isoform X3 n=1 Tax=Ficedula albicollis TaxID=59894 RepID=UPI0007AD7FBD|nr:PREDICTED: protein TALPID3 isoform X3 [Ficedula albicollis]
MAAESSLSSSQGSLRSLTAGEVLVRSTAVRREQLPAGGRGRRVAIAVQKLRAGGSPCPGDSAADGAPHITAGAWAPCGAGTPRDSPGAAPGVLSTKGYPECLLPVENSAPIFLSQMDYPGEAASQDDSSLLLEDSRGPEDDVFISQYATGQKEALRAILMQKTQIVPVHKEVKVQLLGSAPTEKRECAGGDTRSAPREVDSATTIAAATAAAIATAAPLLKVQNDLEAKVNSVSELLQKLQETDRQLQRVSEQQKNMKAQHEDPHYHQRVSELEKQMNAFMVQRIQHLEKLQEQQMNIQSQLISSAVNSRGLQQGPVSSGPLTGHWEKPEQRSLTNKAPSSHRGLFPTTAAPAQVFPEAYSSHFPSHGVHTQKSPLKTPVPRRYAPEPVPKNGKISEKENFVVEKENIPKPAREDEGEGLEHVLSSQEIPRKEMEYSKKLALSGGEKGWPPERYRPSALPADSIPSFVSYNSIEKTVQKADDLLQDLGKLRREMHNILQGASSWKSEVKDLIKSKNLLVSSGRPEHHLPNKPSILQNVKAPRSILTEAERALRGVQNNKKVFEENLEAVTRAKDGDAMYSFGDSSSTNRDVLEGFRIRRTVDEWIKAINQEIQAEITKDNPDKEKHEEKAPWNKRAQNLRAMKTKEEIKERAQNVQKTSLTKRPLSAPKPLQKQVEDTTKKEKFRTYLSEKKESKEKKADKAVGGTALVQNEDYLSQVYGKPIYQGHRSTLKKAPYLRFNSPPSRSKPSRPKLIEVVKGTEVKSARTQTCSHTQRDTSSPMEKQPVCALPQQKQHLFSPSQDVPAASGPVEGHLIPIAIPLGKTQSSSTLPQPAGVILDKPHPVTVTTSLPPEPPKPPVEVKKPNIAVIEMKSEKKEPPQLSVQVLPSVDIDSVSSASGSVNHSPQSSEPQLPPVTTVIQSPEEIPVEEEDTKLPGTDFIEVTDVTQDQEEEKDEIPELHEPHLELNGQLRVASPQYNGPLFPPVVSAPQQSADILDELIQRKETIEDKLVNWVEQEVMAKIIDEMHPAQKETVPNISSSDSESSEVVSPGTVEVAGGGGFQLFVNAGVPVDSEMINNFVKEALSETIATMLGDSKAQRAVPDPSVPSSTITVMEVSMPTPVPTPQATPPPTPPSEKELPQVKTPVLSPSPPEMSEDVHGREKIKETGVEIAAAMCPVVTPVVTPVTTPPPVPTPSPPVSEWNSPAKERESPKLPNPWNGAELPLEEENPSPVLEEPFHPRTVEMSVANDEEPEALVLPSQQLPVRPFEPLPCSALVPSPVPTLSSVVSTQESSLTLTETETTDRPISEGEVLFTYGQPLPAAALAGRGLSLPNLTESLSSTLQDANEMDYDPPSEGQVLRRMDKGCHRDPVLTLLNKLNQALVFVREGINHLEDSDGSIGQLSEGQRPRLTRAQERILMGNSIFMEHPSAQISGNRPRQSLRSASPGQLAQIGAEILGDADASPSPMLLTELESQPGSIPALPATQPSCRITPFSEDLSQEESQGAAPIPTVTPRVIFVIRTSEEMPPEGCVPVPSPSSGLNPAAGIFGEIPAPGEDAAPHLNPHLPAEGVSVQLPGTNTDNETQSLSSAHGDLDSSGTDTF